MAAHSITAKHFDLEAIQSADVTSTYALFQQTHRNPWSLESFSETLSTSHCLVAKKEGLVKGFVLFSVMFEQAEVLYICVEESSRRSGLAALLMKEAIALMKADTVTSLLLEVAEDNDSARSFYQKMHFHVIDVRKNYYHHADGGKSNALVMQRDL